MSCLSISKINVQVSYELQVASKWISKNISDAPEIKYSYFVDKIGACCALRVGHTV